MNDLHSGAVDIQDVNEERGRIMQGHLVLTSEAWQHDLALALVDATYNGHQDLGLSTKLKDQVTVSPE